MGHIQVIKQPKEQKLTFLKNSYFKEWALAIVGGL